MRVLCLLFPRLGLHLAVRQRPALRDRPVVLLQGHGDDALVAAASCEASQRGVITGMSGGEARHRVPEALFLADNAGQCLDELERVASILRLRATPLVALGGRDHLFLDISRHANTPREEELLAQRLAALASTWAKAPVRSGVASSRQEAVEAARAARRGTLVCPPVPANDPPIPSFRPEPLSAEVRFPSHASEVAVRARVQRMLRALDLALEARSESFRAALLFVTNDAGEHELRLPQPQPQHTTASLLDAFDRQAQLLAGAHSVRVELQKLGPVVRVEPCAASFRTVSRTHLVAARHRPVVALPRAS